MNEVSSLEQLVQQYCAPSWKFWVTANKKQRALDRVTELAESRPEVRSRAIDLAIENSITPLIVHLIGSGETRNWGTLCEALASDNKDVWDTISNDVSRSDLVGLAKTDPETHRRLFDVSLKYGCGEIALLFVGSGRDRDWDATCTAISTGHSLVRNKIAFGLTKYQDNTCFSEINDHPEVFQAIDAAFTQDMNKERGFYSVFTLLFDVADGEVAKMSNDFKESIGLAAAGGDDPGEFFKSFLENYEPGTGELQAREIVGRLSEGKYGVTRRDEAVEELKQREEHKQRTVAALRGAMRSK